MLAGQLDRSEQHFQVAKALLQAGASAFARNISGRMPLLKAVHTKHSALRLPRTALLRGATPRDVALMRPRQSHYGCDLQRSCLYHPLPVFCMCSKLFDRCFNASASTNRHQLNRQLDTLENLIQATRIMVYAALLCFAHLFAGGHPGSIVMPLNQKNAGRPNYSIICIDQNVFNNF